MLRGRVFCVSGHIVPSRVGLVVLARLQRCYSSLFCVKNTLYVAVGYSFVCRAVRAPQLRLFVFFFHRETVLRGQRFICVYLCKIDIYVAGATCFVRSTVIAPQDLGILSVVFSRSFYIRILYNYTSFLLLVSSLSHIWCRRRQSALSLLPKGDLAHWRAPVLECRDIVRILPNTLHSYLLYFIDAFLRFFCSQLTHFINLRTKRASIQHVGS